MSISNDDYEMDFMDSHELESELAEVLNRYASKKNSITISEPNLARRNTIAVTSRKQSVDEFMGYERQREKPAQLKLEKEIEMAQKRANELRIFQSVRQLTGIEIEELKKVELEEFEARRKLKRTKDAALRAKRYRIRRAANNDTFSQPIENFFDVGKSQSPEDLRPLSSNSFPDPMASAAAFISKLTGSISPTRKRTHSPSSSFQCSQCDAQFSIFGNFVAHMRSQHLKSDHEESTICKICKSSFQNQQTKLIHMVEHFINTQTTYSCQQCSKVFDNANHYRQHHTNYHTEILQRCGICLQIFTQPGVYQEHVMSHVLADIKYACAACNNISFDSLELLEAHVQLVHDQPDQINGFFKSKYSSNSINGTSPFPCSSNGSSCSVKALKCFVCDHECANENALDEHKLLNHCKIHKADQCAVCRQKLVSVNDFLEHSQQHSDGFGDMNCIICRQAIRNDIQLKMHAEYHLDLTEDSTKCSTCDEMVPQNFVARHFLNHAVDYSTDLKQEDDSGPSLENSEDDPSSTCAMFTCHCGQQFEDQNGLTSHALEHLNETLPGFIETIQTTFDCPKCPKRFSSLSALQGHSHVHMNTKIFKCDKCGQTFATGARLHQHKLKHQNKSDLKCRICDKRFPSGEQLQSHMKIHEKNLNNFGGTKKEILEV